MLRRWLQVVFFASFFLLLYGAFSLLQDAIYILFMKSEQQLKAESLPDNKANRRAEYVLDGCSVVHGALFCVQGTLGIRLTKLVSAVRVRRFIKIALLLLICHGIVCIAEYFAYRHLMKQVIEKDQGLIEEEEAISNTVNGEEMTDEQAVNYMTTFTFLMLVVLFGFCCLGCFFSYFSLKRSAVVAEHLGFSIDSPFSTQKGPNNDKEEEQ